jgi:signal transduction histidine kinase
MRRVLVRWFGAAIFTTGLTVGAVWWLLSPAPRTTARTIEGVERFVGSEFATRWHDAQARDALAARAAAAFEVEIVLRDDAGTVIGRHGPACSGRTVSAPVRDESGASLGAVDACWPHARGAWMTMIVALVAAGAVLWAAAGVLARRLTRPYDLLERFARRLAAGELDARIDPGCRLGREPRIVADALNDMAGRVQAQLAESRVLLAAVSHEIRTPLGHLRVLVELLRDRGGDEATLQDLEREIADLDGLVGKLLADARLQFTAMSTTSLSARAVATRALAQAGIASGCLVVDDGDDGFTGDPSLLGRALGNLLENAVHHGGGVIRLHVALEPEAIVFAVDDDGPGMSDDERAHAFEPFVRGAAGGEGPRLGLGLALVERIALAHGGRAWIEPRSGGGTRVALRVGRHPSSVALR